MEINSLQDEIEELVAEINESHKHSHPELISHLKTIEEIGEITEVVLKSQIKSRKHDKQGKDAVKKELGEEIADTIISLLSLAGDYEINMENHLENRMEEHWEKHL